MFAKTSRPKKSISCSASNKGELQRASGRRFEWLARRSTRSASPALSVDMAPTGNWMMLVRASIHIPSTRAWRINQRFRKRSKSYTKIFPPALSQVSFSVPSDLLCMHRSCCVTETPTDIEYYTPEPDERAMTLSPSTETPSRFREEAPPRPCSICPTVLLPCRLHVSTSIALLGRRAKLIK